MGSSIGFRLPLLSGVNKRADRDRFHALGQNCADWGQKPTGPAEGLPPRWRLASRRLCRQRCAPICSTRCLPRPPA
jgi:hypothetical protein